MSSNFTFFLRETFFLLNDSEDKRDEKVAGQVCKQVITSSPGVGKYCWIPTPDPDCRYPLPRVSPPSVPRVDSFQAEPSQPENWTQRGWQVNRVVLSLVPRKNSILIFLFKKMGWEMGTHLNWLNFKSIYLNSYIMSLKGAISADKMLM